MFLFHKGERIFRELFLKCFPRDSNGWFPVSHAEIQKEKEPEINQALILFMVNNSQ